MLNLQPRDKQSVLIVDSFALLFRGFFSMAMFGNFMKNSNGLYTNGLYQFSRYMLHAIETYAPTHVICAFDMGAKTFRNELFQDYKANREQPPEQLVPQFDLLWDLVEAFNIPCKGKVGFEADDVIGSLARQYAEDDIDVIVLTGDGDALQLISDRTQIAMMKKGFGNYELIGLHNLEQLKGVTHPWQIIELKALMGDASDNIPGCPSVGPKTALKLIDEYGTIDELYANIDQLKGKLKERLLENKALVYLSRELAEIDQYVDIHCTLDECVYDIERSKLVAKFEELEFTTLVRQFAG